MRVATRIALGFGTLVLLLAGLLAYHVSLIGRTADASRELGELTARLTLASTEQVHWLEQLRDNAAKYAVTGDPGYAERFQLYRERFDASVHQLDSLALGPVERNAMADLVRSWEAFGAVADRVGAGEGADAEATAAVEEGVDRLRSRTRRLAAASRAAMEARVRAVASRARRAERVSWLAAGGALLLAVLVSVLVVRSISRSLARLQAGTRAVAAGDLEHRVEGIREGEFAELADAFNRMTRRLGEVERLKRDFLSMISHDLKGPLAAVQEATEALLEGARGELEPRQRRLLELSRDSGRRLSDMISKLLDLARLEAGAVEYRFEPRDVGELVREAAGQTARQAGARGEEREVDVRVRVEEEPLHAPCDPEWLLPCLRNLLENAVAFSPEGGRVEALAGPGPDGTVRVSVADRGPGVPEEYRERIFERFVQGPRPVTAQAPHGAVGEAADTDGHGHGGRSRRERAGGVGLGLAIAHEVAEAHGGRLWVEPRDGGGCVFRLELPRVSAGGGEPAPGASPESRPGERGRRGPRGARRGAAALAAALLLGACGGGPPPPGSFHGHFEAGRYEQAVEAFRADSAAAGDAEGSAPDALTLYRLGVARALPRTPVHAPAAARHAFGRLLESHPGSELTEPARWFVALLEELERLRTTAAGLRTTAAGLRTELEQLKAIDLRPPTTDSLPGR